MPQLTDARIKNASAREKDYKLYDASGLYVLVSKAGGKLWRWRYSFGGKAKQLALGKYPATTLVAARARRDEAQRLLDDGQDPSAQRKAQKAAQKAVEVDRFEPIALEWFKARSPGWAPSHGEKVIRRLERDVFPFLGQRPITALEPPEVLTVLRRIEARGATDTARRALQNCGSVFRFAIATGRAQRDPTQDLRDALHTSRTGHFAAITEPGEVGALLRAIDGYHGGEVVRAALRLAPLVFVRPGELRRARWEDIDLKTARWSFVVSKTGQAHIVPLARQAVDILKDLEPATGASIWVFPGARSLARPMSENAVLVALRALGYEKEQMSGHGWRATARTLLDEALGYPPHLIEHQLAHSVRDPLGRSYNRTQHLSERTEMMQAWADYLDGLRNG